MRRQSVGAKAGRLESRAAGFGHQLHQVDQITFAGVFGHHRQLNIGARGEQMAVLRPAPIRPSARPCAGARHKVVIVHAKARHLVHRVGNQPAASGMFTILMRVRVGFVAKAAFHQQAAFRVDGQWHIQRGGGAGAVWSSGVAPMPPKLNTRSPLARLWRSAASKARRVVAQILRPGQLQPTRGQQFDEFGQVFVLTFAREQFVTNDESAMSMRSSIVSESKPEWQRIIRWRPGAKRMAAQARFR